MTIVNLIKTALLGLGVNLLRSGLTTLGIIIGVASVIAMLALGNGAQKAVEDSFQYLGADVIEVSRKQAFEDGSYEAVGEKLTYEDGLKMAGLSLIKRVQMSVSKLGKLRYGRNVLDLSISGVTADITDILVANGEYQPAGWDPEDQLTEDAFIGEGRFFTDSETDAAEKVCVLGSKTAMDLFQGDYPVGETIWINRQRFLVVGVMAELESVKSDERYNSQPNEGIYLPISSAIELLYDEEPSVYITARVYDAQTIQNAKVQITLFLRERHNVEQDAEGVYQDDFELTTRDDLLGARKKSAQTFSLLLTAMAIVSLVVGGIGIMNVMLVSVTERTREVGVRLSVGAHTRDIIRQFLLEAIILSAGGGFIGVAIGVLSIPLAAKLNEGIAVLAPESIPLSFGLAILTGVIFGLYPAFRAAHLNPVEALRYE